MFRVTRSCSTLWWSATLTLAAALFEAPVAAQATASDAASEPALSASSLRQARSHFERGELAYRAGELKQSLEHFKRAYALAPSAELDFDLAHVYERMGEAGDAIRHYRNYLKRPNLPETERQQIDKRIENLAALQARQRAPLIVRPPPREAMAAEARAFFQRGTKLFRQGKYEAALIAFSEARRFAKLPEINYNLAVTCERLGRSADAARYYRAYLREAEAPADGAHVEARIRALTGESETADSR
jgi:tetratricopeptide (TPR) repeat protein